MYKERNGKEHNENEKKKRKWKKQEIKHEFQKGEKN